MRTGYQLENHKRSIVPLYGQIGNTYDFIGTGTLICYRQQHLLISCAHCFDKNGTHNLIIGARDAFPVESTALVTKIPEGNSRDTDPVDFGVIPLKPVEISRLRETLSFLPENSIEKIVLNELPDSYDVLGFPERDNIPNINEQTLESNAVMFPLVSNRKFQDSKTREKPSWYLPLKFEQHEIQKLSTHGFNVPLPHGMSGGPIFRKIFGNYVTLAGLLIEHHPSRKTLLGLRSSKICNLLNSWWPKIIDIQNQNNSAESS